MIYLRYNKENKVDLIHYMPFHEKHGLGKTQEELELEGVFVEELPKPEVTTLNDGVNYITEYVFDPESRQVIANSIPQEVNPNEEVLRQIEELQNQIDLLREQVQ